MSSVNVTEVSSKTVGPVLGPVLDAAHYRVAAVWSVRRVAEAWAVKHGYAKRDVFRICAGSRNMSFVQYVIRDAGGMVLTESGFASLDSMS